MAIKHLSNISLEQNELQNAVVQNLASAPSSPVEGQIYYDSTSGDKSIYFYNGSAWISIAGDISEVIAGDGLTGGGNNGAVTLNVVGGTGITANANDIAITNTGVTAGSYGSTTAIPTFTVNAQGQLTAAGTAALSTSFTLAADSGSNDTFNNGETLTFAGTSNEIETTVTNKNFKLSEIATNLNEPWGMTFIDDNNLLITEKTGDIIQIDMSTGKKFSIDHELDFFYYGQGGLLDILYKDGYVYVSYSEDREQGRSSTSIARGLYNKDKIIFENIFRAYLTLINQLVKSIVFPSISFFSKSTCH